MSTLFQIDFKVIRTMRRENFSFSFAENVGKFVILRSVVATTRLNCPTVSLTSKAQNRL